MRQPSHETPLRLFDTLTGSTRPFEPIGSDVKLYVCGVTPYDTAHLGHGFTYVAFDVLIRYLQYLGLTVRYVQNVTDIDDPLFEKAQELGISHWDLAREQTDRYLADMQALNLLPADDYPHASHEIPRMVELVQALLDAGIAYTVEGYTYFSVASDPEYGTLSKLDREGMITLARERGGNPDDPRRRDPLDFVLWRPSREGEPSYESPWGAGLPGWHLECSAMSLKYLGAPLDIHGGGNDLIFPHHESEIAQSEGATDTKPFARFWMHTGMVHLDGEKMSKSLGNMVFVRDLIAQHGADGVRLYLSGCHYRDALYFNEALMEEAAALADRLSAVIALPSSDGEPIETREQFRSRFEDRMNDDLDTPGAIAVLRDLADAIESAHQVRKDVRPMQDLLRELGTVLGLRLAVEEG